MGFGPVVVPSALDSATSRLGVVRREAIAFQVDIAEPFAPAGERRRPRGMIEFHMPATSRPGAVPGREISPRMLLPQHPLQSHALAHVCSRMHGPGVNPTALLIREGLVTVFVR